MKALEAPVLYRRCFYFTEKTVEYSISWTGNEKVKSASMGIFGIKLEQIGIKCKNNDCEVEIIVL